MAEVDADGPCPTRGVQPHVAGRPRRSRPLRVTVTGSELFAGRIVALLRGFGLDALLLERPSEGLSPFRSRLERIRHGLATDVFLRIYGRRDLSRLQIWLARLGVPTIILWVGSDVTNHAWLASRMAKERAWHWCVAPWLRDELAEAGIPAEVVRITPPLIPDVVPALPSTFTVLAYALADRGQLYGLEFVLELARRRPEIQFLLLAAIVDRADPTERHCPWAGWMTRSRSWPGRPSTYGQHRTTVSRIWCSRRSRMAVTSCGRIRSQGQMSSRRSTRPTLGSASCTSCTDEGNFSRITG